MRAAPVLAPVAVIAALMIAPRPLRHHVGQLEEIESAYQTIRVVESSVPCMQPTDIPAYWKDGTDAKTRFLRHDEDAETYQSVLLTERREALLTGGRYFESMAIGAHIADPGPDGALDVLIVGHAGGTVYRTLRDHAPDDVTLRCVAIEIDPEVVDIARRHLAHRELEDDRLTLITGEDARTVVNALPEDVRFDLVLIDAYTRTNYVPFQVASREFFVRLEQHLSPGGWIAVNVLGHGVRSPVARAVAATAAGAIGPVWYAPNVYFPGNVILWVAPDRGRGPRLRARQPLHDGLGEAAFAVERLLVRFEPRGDDVILTDDRSPSDKLADQELGLGGL